MAAAHSSANSVNSVHQAQKKSLTVRTAVTEADVASFAKMSLQYAVELNNLGVDLSFQNFEQEIASLPGDFAPPDGVILLASVSSTSSDRKDIGAVALRPLTPRHIYGPVKADTDWTVRTCEMKRLHVLSEWQCCGAGRMLAESAITAAQHIGYKRMVLDSLDRLQGANKLYEKLAFERYASYNGNCLPDVCFWQMTL